MKLAIKNHIVDEKLKISIVEPLMAADLFYLVDENRTYLKKWLPWLDVNRSEEDSLNFIISSVQANEKKEQIVWAVNFRDKLVGVISFNYINWPTRTVDHAVYGKLKIERGRNVDSASVY